KVILRLFTEGERLAEPISLSKQRKTIKGKSDSRDFLQQLDTHEESFRSIFIPFIVIIGISTGITAMVANIYYKKHNTSA
ncbi:hypothetical protein, partial [Marinilactibacillus psychrotolerans]|uniref:hypothetical protein n=1 Tax=Marinilactibacillus psychrotolerans TaxID=191770 RepID=UPI001C7D4720